MSHRLVLLASLILVAAAPCGAQPPASDATATSATSSAAAASSTASSTATAPAKAAAGTDSAASTSKPAGSDIVASSDPSPEMLKKARQEGFKPKKRNGVTQFCRTDATLGTRFESETCYDQEHMEMLVQQREDQRNQLSQQTVCTGCKGH